ncbi:ABC transporter ATP-binding protein [Enterococcus lemanii]|uniref:ABC transporter ATP-binding protein n=1 Tax=Enterococcus lemanii TaxID=1159752 RepID=A0ABV9MXQ7_9ENTE|nr:ABC transporter ATP-binding protein [Enterococcus lemanii]MBM7709654.1 ATP-binding cassette subfamily B protein [Enterococcus lemanii]
MEKSKTKVSLMHSLQLQKKGMQLWYQKEPKIFYYMFFDALLKILMPYILIYFSAQILNELGGMRRPEALFRLVLFTLFIEMTLGILQAIITWQRAKWQNLVSILNDEFYLNKMFEMDYAKFSSARIHRLRAQIKENENWSGLGLLHVLKISEDLFSAVFGIIGGAFLLLGLFRSSIPEEVTAIQWLNHPFFTLLFFIFLLLGILLPPYFMNKSESYWVLLAEESKETNRFGLFFSHYMNLAERGLDVRIYRQDKLSKKYMFDDSVDRNPHSLIARYHKGPMGIYRGLSTITTVLFSGLVYFYVGLKAWAGAFSIGLVTQYISAILALSNYISKLLESLGKTQSNAAFLSKNFELLEEPNEMYQGSLTTEKRSDRKYLITFQRVSFKYPDADTYAIKNLSMQFEIGKRFAIVGENGSGKTTFIKLLCRLYEPTEGVILLNGIDIRKYNYADYLALFSVVFQDFHLFSLTIAQNIASSTNYDEEKVQRCLTEAGLAERLTKTANGIESYLYKDFNRLGIEISGGEAQKIAIARALYKDAPFMILDEPTASLDPIAEEEIYQKFNQMIRDRTAIYISHRLSSCRFCDEILVFNQGELIQRGTHQALVNQKSEKYAELWQAQAQYYQ